MEKTKAMFFNVVMEPLHTLNDNEIKQALTDSGDQDFKYLGSWCDKNRDIHTRKALVWKSLPNLLKIWKSNLSKTIKLQLFRATTEAILFYGSALWSLTAQEERSLNGTYTHMLCKFELV